MRIIRILLLPISFLYGALLFIRNTLFDLGILKSEKFNLPVISVGNLSVGGTGKTPHIEYLIRLLKPTYYIATLSRGYGRKTKGFVVADTQSIAEDIGDEPLQFKKKFPKIPVVVDENRVRGVRSILSLFPSIQGVLLDDAFQHRRVAPGLSIVLTDYNKLYIDDYVVPSGRLREFKSGIKRANIVIVTKCPHLPLPIEREGIIKKLQLSPTQTLYFSTISYGEFIPFQNNSSNLFSKSFYFERNYTILLVTGIANVDSLNYYLGRKTNNIVPIKFPDHHPYSIEDIETIKDKFNNITSANKIILTTEKDMMRLKNKNFLKILNPLPIFYIPIEIEFNQADETAFNNEVLNYVRSNQKNR